MKIMIVKIKKSMKELKTHLKLIEDKMSEDEMIKNCAAGFWGNPKSVDDYEPHLRELTHLVALGEKNKILAIYEVRTDKSDRKFAKAEEFRIAGQWIEDAPRKYSNSTDLKDSIVFLNLFQIDSKSEIYGDICQITNKVIGIRWFRLPQCPYSRTPIVEYTSEFSWRELNDEERAKSIKIIAIDKGPRYYEPINTLIFSHSDREYYYFDKLSKNSKAWEKVQGNLIKLIGTKKANELNIITDVLCHENIFSDWIIPKNKYDYISISKKKFKEWNYNGLKLATPESGRMLALSDNYNTGTEQGKFAQKVINVGKEIEVGDLFDGE